MRGIPEVSVCLPSYNGRTHLRASAESVLAQSLIDLELVVVDDGSEDETLSALDGLTDRRLSIHRNSARLGIPHNWNRALRLARARYVCLFHQDDVMHEDNLAQKVRFLEAHPRAGWVHSAIELREEPSCPRPFHVQAFEQSGTDFVLDGVSYFRRLALRGNRVIAPTVVARTDALRRIGGFNPSLAFASDYEAWLKLCVCGDVGFLSDPLVLYRWHDANASHAFHGARGLLEADAALRNAIVYLRQQSGLNELADVLLEASLVIGEQRRWLADLESEYERLARSTRIGTTPAGAR